MSPELLMLVVTIIVGLSLFFMMITKTGSPKNTFFLWVIQLIVVLSISMYSLKLGLIDTLTSTFGLLTLLMLVLVLTMKSVKKKES